VSVGEVILVELPKPAALRFKAASFHASSAARASFSAFPAAKIEEQNRSSAIAVFMGYQFISQEAESLVVPEQPGR
jgi:hypothetical protein